MSDHPVPDYRRLVGPIEGAALKHGATPQGVCWPNEADSVRRFDAMTGILPLEVDFSFLDVGCGPGLLLDYLNARGLLAKCEYLGLDIIPIMIEQAVRDWPNHAFQLRDILSDPLPESSFDFTIVCGACTGRCDLSYGEMENFTKMLVSAAWRSTRRALAFNVMSIHVDWEREDLFHWPIDTAVAFCKRELSRHVSIRADYGLYEYTVQVYREPIAGSVPVPKRWLRKSGAPLL